MTSVRFEWDEAKNRSNQRKHDGVSFVEASQVFRDPLHVSARPIASRAANDGGRPSGRSAAS